MREPHYRHQRYPRYWRRCVSGRDDHVMENLVPIGRFSKICRLSVSSLRYYDELGLLRPALVDPDSSYRYYRLSQVRAAETIRLLRALDMPLEEVRRYLE